MKSQPKKIHFGRHTFVICDEVYEPSEDSFLIARNLSLTNGERVLDMGTGCGILAVIAAEKVNEVIAVDVNPYAVECARKNAELNDVAVKVEVREGNLFSPVRDGEKFDLILFNAPYLPVEGDEGKNWIEKAWSGGETGRTVIDRFIDEVSEYLTEKGRALLVQSTFSDVDKTLEEFSKRGLIAKIIVEKRLFFESIMLIEVTPQNTIKRELV